MGLTGSRTGKNCPAGENKHVLEVEVYGEDNMAFCKKGERLMRMFYLRKKEERRDGQDGHEDEGGEEESEEDEKKGDGRRHARDIGC